MEEKIRLSKENYNKLDENFLYKRPPIINNSFSVGTVSGTYHCKNWTFKVYKRDGRAWAADTYFGDRYEELTDENFGLYEKVFDFREVKKIRDNERDEYEEKDIIVAATDSGGYSCGHICWVLNTAKKSQRLLIEKCKNKINSLENHIQWEKRDLEKYIDGTHYKLKE